MALKMTAELNKIFDSCKEDSLDAKTSHLIALAVHLVADNAASAAEVARRAHSSGVTAEQLHRLACLCACTGGVRINDLHFRVTKDLPGMSGAKSSDVHQLERSTFSNCSAKALDKRTTHLVGLAACLASSCQCARGHIVEARNAGVTAVQLARCACIASCIGGLRLKYDFLEHLESVKNCNACAC